MANPSTTSSSNIAVSFFFLRFGGGGLCAFSLADNSSSSPLSSSCLFACMRWALSRRLLRLIRCCFISVSILSRHVSRSTRNKLRPVVRRSAGHRDHTKTNHDSSPYHIGRLSDVRALSEKRTKTISNLTRRQRRQDDRLRYGDTQRGHCTYIQSHVILFTITISTIIIIIIRYY